MKRRTFLTSLFAIPAGLVAAVKALAKPREWRCIISPDVKVIDMRSATWTQRKTKLVFNNVSDRPMFSVKEIDDLTAKEIDICKVLREAQESKTDWRDDLRKGYRKRYGYDLDNKRPL